ncbi:hypothetical protein GA0061105_1495 [Rhizobium aethiopicum]|uniref:Uncharacterized protein n=1 Tax=Rhizobium aethiopicum TaxID=1138170 RepID=A0A1C3YCT2_9HYPH|nr:hypothetical protein GA0061105_1495 [Rhizobium aethiopicum]
MLLVTLVFAPTNVTFVMVPDHHLPATDGLAVPVTAPSPSIDDGSPLLALPIDVNAGVEGVFEDADHIAITYWHPYEVGHAPFIRRPREVNLIFRHRQQHLTRASKVVEAGEDGSNYLLQTQIRIEPKPGLPMPNVAERNGKSQFATARLRPGGIEHPGSQHAQFELADTALHSQQQPIVGSTWIVDAVMVNDAGFDQAAQFEQVMPVPTVARKP